MNSVAMAGDSCLIRIHLATQYTALRLLDLTLPTPAENVALDEALLLQADQADEQSADVLRIWEFSQPVVVLGRASRIDVEADQDYCAENRIPIFRRSSGGATILAGPGCLMYSMVLNQAGCPELQAISATHQFVLNRIVTAFADPSTSHWAVQIAGTSDLAFDSHAHARRCGSVSTDHRLIKFSGNSMRRTRNHVLYHGTLLYDFPISQIQTSLLMPPRTPDYRDGRKHVDFVGNLPITRDRLVEVLRQAWPTDEVITEWPSDLVTELVETKYARTDWNESGRWKASTD